MALVQIVHRKKLGDTPLDIISQAISFTLARELSVVGTDAVLNPSEIVIDHKPVATARYLRNLDFHITVWVKDFPQRRPLYKSATAALQEELLRQLVGHNLRGGIYIIPCPDTEYVELISV